MVRMCFAVSIESLLMYADVCCCELSSFFFFSSRRRHTRYWRDWSSDVCSSDLDVSDTEAVEAFAERVSAAHGVPDIVVNNAGIGHAGGFLDTPAGEFDRVLDINLGGVVNGCRAFGRRLVERGTGGHIVNVASMAAYAPFQSLNAYCTSKAAAFMFSDCLRAELDAADVGLTTICPGVINTNIVNTTRFDAPAGKIASIDDRRDRKST